MASTTATTRRKRRRRSGAEKARKRPKLYWRSIVSRSSYTLRRRPLPELWPSWSPLRPRILRDNAKIGDSFDIFSLLFTNPTDFLVSYHHHRKVRANDIRGKTVLVYILPLTVYHAPPGGLSPDTLSLIAAYNERDLDFEVIFVPVERGPAFFHNCAENRFRDWFSKMPWLALPFTNKLACDRIQEAFRSIGWVDLDPYWVILNPSGSILLTSALVPSYFFNSNGIAELVPRLHKMLPSSIDGKGKPKPFLSPCLTISLRAEDRAVIRGKINLNRLLGSPCPDFLLAKDGNKVSVSSLEDKVIGLYFHNHDSRHSCMDSIKKIYEEVIQLGYDFEIVQVNLHSSLYVHGNLSHKAYCENIPWLTLPYMDSCCKRLIRIFDCYDEGERLFSSLSSYIEEQCGDRLVIISPHKSNIGETFFDGHGADIIHHFGIEAYPFTRRRVCELEYARIKEEIKLQLIFGPGGPPLLQQRGGSYDQVPVSQLWGKKVILLFATHSAYKSSEYVATLESKYLEQDKQNGGNVFEVVYISYDADSSTFDDCITKMPWLVHPYSCEFAHMWGSRISKIFAINNNVGYSDSEDDSYSDCDTGDGGHKGGIVAFDVDGEFIAKNDYLDKLLGNTEVSFCFKPEFPFFYPYDTERGIIEDVIQKYGLSNDFYR